jgi:hypothetical protein
MNLLRIFRQSENSTRRLQIRPRRPLVEALEGRQLQSGFTVTAAAIQGNHIGAPAVIQGNHIGMEPAIVGSHIGTNVV